MIFGRSSHTMLDDNRAPAIDPEDVPAGVERAAFAAGCFWGVEDFLRELPGVVDVVVGYEGGAAADPTYEAVCTGSTGHAETALVTFDPTVIAYTDLLEAFFRHHDPTTPNRQGPDVGTQYRSAIFTHGPEQERLAREALESYSARFRRPIVTEVVPATTFWPAEAYHQGFTARTGRGSCHVANW